MSDIEEAKAPNGEPLPQTSKKKSTTDCSQQKRHIKRASSSSQDGGYTFLHAQKYVREKKKMPCQECGLRFFHRSHLQAHQETHRKQKKFVCYECGKSFSKKFNFERHQESHSAYIQPVVCTKAARRKKKVMMTSHFLSQPE